jgi:GT2 family glycosyltransferase
MISVVIPTLNTGETLAQSLGVLIQASVDGLVREVVIVDGGSTDDTFAIADDAGATFLAGPVDQAERVAIACAAARGPWLLILMPGMRLGSEWAAAAKAHMTDHPKSAAHFRLALDDHRVGARLKEAASGLFGRGGEAVLMPKRLHGEPVRSRALPARVFRI